MWEYLLFDPTRQWVEEGVRGWRREGEAWGAWPPEEGVDGRRAWRSAVVGLLFRPEGVLLRAEHPERGILPIRREIRARLASELAARHRAEERAANLERQLRAAQAALERLREGGER